MHTAVVPEQVNTMKIQVGIQVSRPSELRRQLQLWKCYGRLHLIVFVLVRNITSCVLPNDKVRVAVKNVAFCFKARCVLLQARCVLLQDTLRFASRHLAFCFKTLAFCFKTLAFCLKTLAFCLMVALRFVYF
nr:hypothetical protein [Tanacetum cinerariifolium]